jgi:hypothetical protein
MRADYLERVRCHAFLVTLGLTVYFAYLAMPPRHAHYATLEIANRRGLYNSAWVGCLVALMTSAFLSLVGFYLIKNAIDRDRRTGVGQILAATPLAKWHYTLGKWASNLAVLGTMVATMAVCAVGMQLLRGEDRSIDPLAIVIPLAVVTLPAMAVTAGFAVLFEALPVLMGGLGNVAFFLVWAFGFTGPDLASAHHYRGIGSALGLSTILPSMMRSVQDAFGITAGPTSFNLGFNIDSAPRTLQTFPWAGMKWSADLLAGRLAWTLIGVGLALAAAIPFDRFDARSTNAGGRGRATSRPGGGEDTPRPVLGTVSDDISGAPGDPAAGSGPATPYAPASAAVLTAAKRSESALPLLLAELRLAVHGMPRAWFAVAGGLALACWFTPLSVARGWILPFAWIWPLLAWSALGGRESRHGTTALVFSAPRILTRQLPAVWLAGVVLALAMGLGVGLRLFLAGNVPGALAWGVGALFIPALALAAGVWSGGGKLFEVLYLLLWYAGPMNRTPFLDFIGTSDATTRSGATAGFAIAALGLLAIAALGRWRAVRT